MQHFYLQLWRWISDVGEDTLPNIGLLLPIVLINPFPQAKLYIYIYIYIYIYVEEEIDIVFSRWSCNVTSY